MHRIWSRAQQSLFSRPVRTRAAVACERVRGYRCGRGPTRYAHIAVLGSLCSGPSHGEFCAPFFAARSGTPQAVSSHKKCAWISEDPLCTTIGGLQPSVRAFSLKICGRRAYVIPSLRRYCAVGMRRFFFRSFKSSFVRANALSDRKVHLLLFSASSTASYGRR